MVFINKNTIFDLTLLIFTLKYSHIFIIDINYKYVFFKNKK